ncbi:hypothetical protein CsSME_00024492 [Camellia sinensis var. sinensis]
MDSFLFNSKSPKSFQETSGSDDSGATSSFYSFPPVIFDASSSGISRLNEIRRTSTNLRLALWRYKPPPKAPPRNHPLLLLSGVGTNAIGYDLSPDSSFARYMSSQGFDTWILELRGAGLSTEGVRFAEVNEPVNAISENINPETGVSPSTGEGTARVTKSEKSRLVTKLTKSLMNLSERLYGWLDEGLLVAGKNSIIASQIRDLRQRLINIIEDGEQSPFSHRGMYVIHTHTPCFSH